MRALNLGALLLLLWACGNSDSTQTVATQYGAWSARTDEIRKYARGIEQNADLERQLYSRTELDSLSTEQASWSALTVVYSEAKPALFVLQDSTERAMEKFYLKEGQIKLAKKYTREKSEFTGDTLWFFYQSGVLAHVAANDRDTLDIEDARIKLMASDLKREALQLTAQMKKK